MLYLREIGAGEVKRVVEAVPQSILLDFDRDNQLIGIEILNADQLLPRQVLQAAEPL